MKKLVLVLFLFPFILFAQQKKITFDDLYRLGTFKAETVPGFHSMNDGRFYTEKSDKGLQKNNFITSETVETIVNASDAKDENGKPLPLDDVEWNGDETKLLIFTKKEKIYRRSSKAIVYAFDLATKQTIKIDTAKILNATYSPDGSKVAFVKSNNLYFKNLQTGQTMQVTTDGEWNKIINGNADWVYEEEFAFTKAFQWSKNGTSIAYYRFDESKVPQYNMTMYKDLYPGTYSYKYPKAGEPNSVIEIHIYNLASGKDVKADIGLETDMYIPRIKWTKDDSKLGIAWLNRLQNHLKWLSADAATGSTSSFYDETSKWYVEINDELVFTADGKSFIITSERDGHRHIYLQQMDGKKTIQLSSGNYDVSNILGVDDKNKTVYFTAAIASPMDRQLFAVSYAKTPVVRQITKGLGTHKTDLNSDFTYYVDNYSSLNSPTVIAIYDMKGTLVKTLKDNAALKNKLNEYAIGKAAFIKLPNTKGDTLNGWMLKPADFDAAKNTRFCFATMAAPAAKECWISGKL